MTYNAAYQDPPRGNSLGAPTLQRLTEELARIRVNLNNIDLDKQDETTLKVELKQINYSSWSASQLIDKDIEER